MASAVEVQKYETSTLRQSHHFISIALTFGMGDQVRDVTSPVKFDLDPMSGRDATWGQHIRVVFSVLPSHVFSMEQMLMLMLRHPRLPRGSHVWQFLPPAA